VGSENVYSDTLAPDFDCFAHACQNCFFCHADPKLSENRQKKLFTLKKLRVLAAFNRKAVPHRTERRFSARRYFTPRP
jgi:hypothetical protein